MQKISVDTQNAIGVINKNIYGHFSEHLGRCVYQGMYVGKDSAIPNVNGMRADVVAALRNIRVPVLRWPGGCFADEYHWRDGIGPQSDRKRMMNTNWGGVVEDNSFGTHEFLEFCEQVGCEPYICGNVGSGTVREMAEWVEYLNSDGDSTVVRERWANGRKDAWNVKYWGVGNESWGCGGSMRPEFYADEYRRYQTYCRTYGKNKLYRIACGANADDYHWTEVLMREAAEFMDGLSLHCYTLQDRDEQNRSSATEFSLSQYYGTLVHSLRMEELVNKHSQIMDRYDPARRVGLIVDEWGAWYDSEPGTNPHFLFQQNTMRDALIAAMTLHIFNRHCDRVVMSNIAQIINVLQSVILTDGEKMLLTPTYHVYDLLSAHQDAEALPCRVETEVVGEGFSRIAQLDASASRKDGCVTVTIANVSADAPAEVLLSGANFNAARARGRVLSGAMNAHNDFDASPLRVEPFCDFSATSEGLTLRLPACSVTEITISDKIE